MKNTLVHQWYSLPTHAGVTDRRGRKEVGEQFIDNTDKEGGAVRRICADTCSIVLRIHVVRFKNAERDPESCETKPEGILEENVITF